jgi:hypothetical protein
MMSSSRYDDAALVAILQQDCPQAPGISSIVFQCKGFRLYCKPLKSTEQPAKYRVSNRIGPLCQFFVPIILQPPRTQEFGHV